MAQGERRPGDPGVTIDRFVSMGVHEHAGRDCKEQWIASIARGLRPGGVGLNSHVLRSFWLNMQAIENRSSHDHRTVEQWLRNCEANRERIRAIDPVLVTW